MKIYQAQLGKLHTNCYLVADEGKNAAIIDPGAPEPELFELIEKNGLLPRMILLTHAHHDHTGGVKALKERFEELAVVIGEKDLRLLEGILQVKNLKIYADPENYAGLTADRTVKDGDALKVGTLTFGVMGTPGHTAGGMTYLCGGSVFCGDTLFREEAGRTDLESGDYGQLLDSLKRLSELPDEYRVYPGHEEASTIAHEREFNRYVKIANER